MITIDGFRPAESVPPAGHGNKQAFESPYRAVLEQFVRSGMSVVVNGCENRAESSRACSCLRAMVGDLPVKVYQRGKSVYLARTDE